MERLVTNLKEEVKHAEDILKSKANNSTHQIGVVRQRLQAALDTAQSAVGNVEEKAVACAQTTTRTMREHVFESVGIALGVGLLVGFVLSRK